MFQIPKYFQEKQSQLYRHKAFFVAIFFMLMLTACEPAVKKHIFEGTTMGTYYRVTVVTDDKFILEDVRSDIESELNDINQAMSTYIPDSEISRFNQDISTEWTEISEIFYHVLLESLATSIETDGAFDITVGPLVERWGFGSTAMASNIPSEDELSQMLEYVGFTNIKASVDSSKIQKLHPLTQIDMSAIAKGFAVDRVSRRLQMLGYSRYLVDIGGEMAGYGDNFQNREWVIGIEKPVTETQEAIQLVKLRDKSIATSGDYRNFFEKNGEKYTHTINPKTGLADYHKLASVSVVANEAMRADALATALMVMGEDKAYQFAIDHYLPVFLVVREQEGFKILISPEMEKYLVK